MTHSLMADYGLEPPSQDRAAHLALEALLGELHGRVDKHEAAHEEQVGSPMSSSDLH